MTEKEQQIIELLRQGKSYLYIQSVVKVSPSKIANVKKNYIENGSEFTEDTTATTTMLLATTSVNTGSSDTTTENYIESQNNLINNLKNKLTMNTDEIFEDDDLDYSEKGALEKIKLKMAHDLALKKLEREDEEISLRKRELRLKEEQASSEKRKTEKQGRSLIFRFRKLAEKVENGEWTYGEIDKCSEKATELKEAIEEYCFENDIDTDELSVLVILNKLESEFEGLQDENADEDDSIDIEFEDNVLELAEHAKEIDFESYE